MQGGRGVAGETAERIAAAVEKLGYVPRGKNTSARRDGQRTALIALLMEELSLTAFPDAVYGPIIRAVEAEARRHQLGMLLATTDGGSLPETVRDNQVQGVIILGGCPANDAIALQLHAESVPLVLVDSFLHQAPIPAILPDNEWGGYLAYQHLVRLGHRRIAMIEGPPKYRTLSDRSWGARRAAEELDVPIADELRQPSISSGFPNKGYREMKKLLSLPERPTAVFAVSDRAAQGAMDAIREAGLRIPDDISLVGFDDLSQSAHALPPLTTVRYAREQMGRLAVAQLLARLNQVIPPDDPLRTNVRAQLVVRASTGPAPASG